MSSFVERLEPRATCSATSVDVVRVGDTLQVTGTVSNDLIVIRPSKVKPNVVALIVGDDTRPLYTTPLMLVSTRYFTDPPRGSLIGRGKCPRLPRLAR